MIYEHLLNYCFVLFDHLNQYFKAIKQYICDRPLKFIIQVTMRDLEIRAEFALPNRILIYLLVNIKR